MAEHSFFIAGTDTGVGKTFVSAALLTRARQQGYTVAACKPVAAGAEDTASGLRNEDALTLMAAMDDPPSYRVVNPVCLRPAIAPHIAADEEGMVLSVSALATGCRTALDAPVDFALVEGAGGWRVPLNDRQTLADLAAVLRLPVILVVAMRLGCLNHALLSAEAIRRDRLSLAGWVANSPEPQAMARYRENLQTLHCHLGAPCLGALPWQGDGDFRAAASALVLPAGLERAPNKR